MLFVVALVSIVVALLVSGLLVLAARRLDRVRAGVRHASYSVAVAAPGVPAGLARTRRSLEAREASLAAALGRLESLDRGADRAERGLREARGSIVGLAHATFSGVAWLRRLRTAREVASVVRKFV